MPTFWLILSVLALAALGYVLGRKRATASAGGDTRVLHSLPKYYGANVAMKVIVPSVLIMVGWLLIQPIYVGGAVSSAIPDNAIREGSSRDLVMSEVRRTAEGVTAALAQGAMTQGFAADPEAPSDAISEQLKAAGQIVTAEVTQPVWQGAQRYRALTEQGRLLRVFPHLSHWCVFLRHRMGAQLFGARRRVRVGCSAAAVGHALYFGGCVGCCGADRAVLGDLPV